MNWELPDVQVGFRKGRGTRDQIADICWIIDKATEFQKNIYFCFIDYTKAFDCVDHDKLWKILQEMGIPTTWSASWEICMQVKKRFQILKDDAVKVLHSKCQQIWKTQQCPQDCKKVQSQRKAMPKNAQTTAQLHICKQNAQNSPSQASTVHELRTSRWSSWI